jgi:hypothetical protein
MAQTQPASREPVPDRAPRVGDDAVDERTDREVYVVGRPRDRAGEVYHEGASVDERYDVEEDRAVVSVVSHRSLRRCRVPIDSYDDVVAAIAAGVVVPTPVPVSLVAPLVDGEADN